MFLAKPEVIERLNAYYVPVSIDVTRLRPGNRGWYDRLLAQLRPKYPFVMGPSAWIVAPDGKPLRCIDVQQIQHDPEAVVRILGDVTAELGLQKGPPLGSYVPEDLQHMKPDDVALHVTSRFLLDAELNSLDRRVQVSLSLPSIPPNPAPVIPVKELFGIRLISPIDEWCVLSGEERGRLLPPAGRGVGAAYAIPSGVAALVYRHLCPPTFNAHLDGAVLESQMTGTVVRAEGETVIALRGRYACQHQLWGGPDTNIAEGDVCGYLRFDTATRRITSLGLATDPGIYGDRAGFRVPFVAVAELWKGPRGADAAWTFKP